jgi:hypothetical protein
MPVPVPVLAALRHWKLIVGTIGVAATGFYIASLRADLSDVRAERAGLQAQLNQIVGAVGSGLTQIGVERTVTADTVVDEIGWLVGEYFKVGDSLERQNRALAEERAKAQVIRVRLDKAVIEVSRVRRERDRLADQIRNGTGALTDEEWSQL